MLDDLKTHGFANVERCLFYLGLSTIFGGRPDWSVVWENWKIKSVENHHDLKFTETQLVSTSVVPAKQLRRHKPKQNFILKQNDMQTGRWNGRKPSSWDVPHTPKCHTQELHGSVQKGAWWTPNWLAFLLTLPPRNITLVQRWFYISILFLGVAIINHKPIFIYLLIYLCIYLFIYFIYVSIYLQLVYRFCLTHAYMFQSRKDSRGSRGQPNPHPPPNHPTCCGSRSGCPAQSV